MTDKNLTEIIVITDRSGSMASVIDDSILGFNTFLKEQQEQKDAGRCLITYTQFNTRSEIIHKGIPIEEMSPLDSKTFVPMGMTALLDAVGHTVLETGRRFSLMKEEERPGNVVVVILTDGKENASREFSYKRIQDMVKEQTDKYNWSFIFLGQNIDAFNEARNLGIDPSHEKMYVGDMLLDSSGHTKAYGAASQAVGDLRKDTVKGVRSLFSLDRKRTYKKTLKGDDKK
jgi:hypothetical protein